MPLGWFRAEQFRCLSGVELELDPRANLFIGPNASGKTSLLEAAFFLSRGTVFPQPPARRTDSPWARAFLLAGRSEAAPAPIPLGVRASRNETEWRVGGAPAYGIADLAEQFPAQVIDPEVHKLLEEGPGRRRRFLDWGVFHVEPSFLDTGAATTRPCGNGTPRSNRMAATRTLPAWEQELAASGETLAAAARSLPRADRRTASMKSARPCSTGRSRSRISRGWDSDRIASRGAGSGPAAGSALSRDASRPASR